MAQRQPLSLTAELERLEQQITLTYQEIDHNFARSHRIVTSSILPIIERYAKESEAVWEGSRFWKQFFEASANVALSNYQEEEPAYEDEAGGEADETTRAGGDETTRHESTFAASSPGNYSRAQSAAAHDRSAAGSEAGEGGGAGENTTVSSAAGGEGDSDLLDDSLLESLDLGRGASSTPKAARPRPHQKWADVPSPYEREKADFLASPAAPQLTTNLSNTDPYSTSSIPPPPSTPRRADDTDMTDSSPFHPATGGGRTPATGGRLLHRQLDKAYRIQATPLGKTPGSRYRTAPKPATPARGPRFSAGTQYGGAMDLDLDASPGSPEEPMLHTTLFPSPEKAGKKPKTPRRTPARMLVDEGEDTGGGFAAPARERRDWSDSDDDSELLMPEGYSPPKTIQFSLPPSKLLATPAREASRRIVNDILQTAGAGDDSGTSAGREDEDTRRWEGRYGAAAGAEVGEESELDPDVLMSSPVRGAEEDPF